MMNLLKKGSIILLMMFVSIFSAFSAETEEKEFNAGDFIFGHIRNAYGWHITAYNDEEITIPLPVIVIARAADGSCCRLRVSKRLASMRDSESPILLFTRDVWWRLCQMVRRLDLGIFL